MIRQPGEVQRVGHPQVDQRVAHVPKRVVVDAADAVVGHVQLGHPGHASEGVSVQRGHVRVDQVERLQRRRKVLEVAFIERPVIPNS